MNSTCGTHMDRKVDFWSNHVNYGLCCSKSICIFYRRVRSRLSWADVSITWLSVSSGRCGELGSSIGIDEWIVVVGPLNSKSGTQLNSNCGTQLNSKSGTQLNSNCGTQRNSVCGTRWIVHVGPTWTEKLTFGQTMSIMVYVVLSLFVYSIGVFGAV